jgi:hypothetical protein
MASPFTRSSSQGSFQEKIMEAPHQREPGPFARAAARRALAAGLEPGRAPEGPPRSPRRLWRPPARSDGLSAGRCRDVYCRGELSLLHFDGPLSQAAAERSARPRPAAGLSAGSARSARDKRPSSPPQRHVQILRRLEHHLPPALVGAQQPVPGRRGAASGRAARAGGRRRAGPRGACRSAPRPPGPLRRARRRSAGHPVAGTPLGVGDGPQDYPVLLDVEEHDVGAGCRPHFEHQGRHRVPKTWHEPFFGTPLASLYPRTKSRPGASQTAACGG